MAFGADADFKQPGVFPRPAFVVGNRPKAPFIQRLGRMRDDFSPFMTEFQEITDYVRPRRGRYLVTDRNRPRTHKNIINNTATIASRTLQSGMMGGVSSPARPWFRLATNDPDLNKSDAVKTYLATVAQRLLLVFAKSNLYNALHTIYGDLGDFGTGCLVIDQDYEDVARGTVFSPGEYYIGLSDRNVVNTIYRPCSFTVMQMIERWGSAVSPSVMRQYDVGNYDQWIECLHVIEPNMQQVKGVGGPNGMPFVGVYMETGGDNEMLLERKGYQEWPAPTPRWDVMSGDSYGNGPGLDAKGDAKALQDLEREKGKGIKKMITPPVQRPTSLGNEPVSHMPGGVTSVPETTRAAGGIRSIYDIRAEGINAIAAEISNHERRINTAYYADLFLMLSQSDRREITAREVEERHEEKLLALGPVLERLHDELLNVAINRVYAIMARNSGPDENGDWQGLLPEPPQELQGKEIRIEYISILAQAQKAVAIGGIERVAGFIGNLAAAKPEALDRLDVDKTIDEYADNVGVFPEMIVSVEATEKVRQQRQQEMQQAKQAELMKSVASSGKDAAAAGAVLADAKPQGDSLLGIAQSLGASQQQ